MSDCEHQWVLNAERWTECSRCAVAFESYAAGALATAQKRIEELEREVAQAVNDTATKEVERRREWNSARDWQGRHLKAVERIEELEAALRTSAELVGSFEAGIRLTQEVHSRTLAVALETMHAALGKVKP